MNQPYEVKVIQTSHYTVELFLDYFNERLRVDDYRGNIKRIVEELDLLMDQNNFTKLIFFTRSEHWQQLLSRGFVLEGMINGFFNGSDNYLMTKYKAMERRISEHWLKEDAIIAALQETKKSIDDIKAPHYYHFRKASTKDCKQLALLYSKVFSVYPTPMNEPEYVQKVLKQGAIFYVVESNKQIVSAASADVNQTLHHAELTDCATLPEHRKYGLMKKLLGLLETELRNQGIYCAFSLARAQSYGMNAALYQLGYTYTGRLTNNCYIFDSKLEDMNVWVKDLASRESM